MKLDPIALAVPFFFLLIGLELFVAQPQATPRLPLQRRLRRPRMRRRPSGWCCCSSGRRCSALYDWIYDHGRLLTFAPGSAWPWLIALVGVDFAYYWWHRLSHEVNFLWAVHVVHHQSEDYNLAVALRQAVLSPVTVLPFYLPLAVLGVPTTPSSSSTP